MQNDNEIYFSKTVGKIINDIRKNKLHISLNQLAYQYVIDKGNLSKTERGIYGLKLSSAYKISEALGIKFSEFASILENLSVESFC